ncbi:3-keto-5-aminohexanoate cleavage protein [Sphingomonas bacterium]|uniref:3-keto-5-aminohexanoate cleavage protein n=1 Tax=Sphingomonas bacterium TaxID=1895847 RepID=UPI001575A751|nr:3-keto-5-aminohexanoate cleavage protein [Sphingomonas bacterium]
MQPLIIELAMNGETRPSRNPHVSRSPNAIADEAIACIDLGAALVHNHSDDPMLVGEAAAARYSEGWTPILAAHPDAILCPTNTGARDPAERLAHLAPCAKAGARMAAIDTGSMNMPLSGGGVGQARMLSYVNDFDRIATILAAMREAGLAASIGIYEPGFLRAAIAFHRAGLLPPGSFAKLYFFGGANYHDATPCIGFGLSPSAAALDAYLDIIGGSGLPWAAAVVGGCVVDSGMAALAIARGGHVRVGLEDHAGPRTPTNAELIAEIAGLARVACRPLATPAQAAKLLGMSPAGRQVRGVGTASPKS